jgi:excisionase family DNA binding protein
MTLNRYEVLERLSERVAQGPLSAAASPRQTALSDETSLAPTIHNVPVEPKAVFRSLLLTVPEACAELRVSRAQLYILTNKQRVIEMIHIGKLARIPRASLEAYVQQLRQHQRLATRLGFDNELCA